MSGQGSLWIGFELGVARVGPDTVRLEVAICG
jgi:hypothetical protein